MTTDSNQMTTSGIIGIRRVSIILAYYDRTNRWLCAADDGLNIKPSDDPFLSVREA